MLKELHIQNIILIESAKLTFQSGFHVFSGETGAGKTAVLQALELILGKRCDTSIIRNGSEKATVQALFDLDIKESVYSILTEAGIDVEKEDDLIVKREISTLGKNRIFINNQMAQLSLLKQIAPHLMEIVAQHASQKLFDPSFHRTLLDRFGQHLDLTKKIKDAYSHIQSLEKELLQLKEREEKEKNQKNSWQQSFDEIDSANIESPDEEETLFQEYETLSHSKELHDSLSKAYYLIQGEDPNILSLLKSSSNDLCKITLTSPVFNRIQDEFRSLTDNLAELSFSVLQYRDTLEEDPERLFEIDERIKLLRSLSKTYGPTLQDVIEKKESLLLSLNNFEEISENKDSLQNEIDQKKQDLQKLTSTLTTKRKSAKALLEKRFTPYLMN